MNVTELRPGNYFLDEGNLYQVLDILLNKTAMRKMVAKVKVKNLRTGAITELARNSGYDVERTSISKKKITSIRQLQSWAVSLMVLAKQNARTLDVLAAKANG